MKLPHAFFPAQRRTPMSASRITSSPVVTARTPVGFRISSFAATLAVLELARKIEPDIVAAMNWYRDAPIAELGNLSARQLVAQGEAESVVAFLKAIHGGDRG